MSQQSFADLGVSSAVTDALSERGFTAPFAIQRLVIADVLAGRDVLAKSPTGSGKTLAFGVPIADLIEATDPRPAALVLAPTRELATQIVEETRSVAHARALSIAPVYGGVGFEKQIRNAQRAHIIVATPGRLEDLLERGALSLDKRPDPRARRGRPHARHGLPPRRRPHRRPVPARAPDPLLLGHARRRGRPRRPGLHRPRRPPPRARARPRPAPRRSSTASSPWSATTASPRSSTRSTPIATWLSSSCAPSAAPTGWRSGSVKPWRHRRRHARRQVPEPAREGARPLRGGPRRHADRHRRGGARHRRRAASRTSSTSTRPRTATATCTASGAPAGPDAPASGITFVGGEQAGDVAKIAAALSLHREFEASGLRSTSTRQRPAHSHNGNGASRNRNRNRNRSRQRSR